MLLPVVAGFANFIRTDWYSSCLILIFLMAVFLNMVIEDFRTKLIDIRKMVVLATGLMMISHYPATYFIVEMFIYYCLFRMLYILIFVVRMKTGSCGGDYDADALDESLDDYCPLLPAYLGGLVLCTAFIYPLAYAKENAYLMADMPDDIIVFYALILGAILAGMEIAFRMKVKKDARMEGIGMGDVIILPAFAAFLGGGGFLLSMIATAVLLGVYQIGKKLVMRRLKE